MSRCVMWLSDNLFIYDIAKNYVDSHASAAVCGYPEVFRSANT